MKRKKRIISHLHNVLWFIISLEIVADLLFISIQIWTSISDPEDLNSLLILWIHPISVLATLIYARAELWDIEKGIEKEIKKSKENNRKDSQSQYEVETSRVIILIILFIILPVPDTFSLTRDVKTNQYTNSSIRSASIAISIVFLIISTLCWLWMMVTALILVFLKTKEVTGQNTHDNEGRVKDSMNLNSFAFNRKRNITKNLYSSRHRVKGF
jgi:hypothetical protein